jgi:hypothetical protein
MNQEALDKTLDDYLSGDLTTEQLQQAFEQHGVDYQKMLMGLTSTRRCVGQAWARLLQAWRAASTRNGVQ